MRTSRVDTTIFGATSLLTLALGGVAPEQITVPAPVASEDAEAVAGLWLSADKTVRLRLDADWSYLGRVAGRHRAAKGTYRPEGTGLVLRDDTGLRTPVTIADDVLEMAGHHLFRA
ncbi:Atu4866 domain-containing protein [Actinoplanes sp. NPDC048967]|uniref:Atu4866 domain-containing protein n=1 Tax=Actinoplanes sp. NPDC048967 TaxID=3155269 RepID=UPI0033D253F4